MQINDKFNMLELIAQLSFYDKTTRERKMARFKQDFEVYEQCTRRRLMQPEDCRFTTETEMQSFVEWTCSLPLSASLTNAERIALMRSCAIILLVFEEAYYTSQFLVDDVYLFPNATFVPRSAKALPEDILMNMPEDEQVQYDKLYSRTVHERIDQVVVPLKQLKLLPEELAYVKIILLLSRLSSAEHDINFGALRPDAMKELLRWKDRMTTALFQFYESIDYKNYEERYGNILLSACGAVSCSASSMEVYQIMRIFGTVQHDNTTRLLLDP
ncbi:Nuclear hormone receptor family member nhr-19 [Aphelenchoides avenae]|nr:Nuclear hormone receptor family member nhr-19 [Aphelenchus avenae]